MQPQQVFAFIFKSQSFGETDEIFTLYSKECGKFRALAKGTKRSQSRLRFGLLPVAKNEVRVILNGSKLAKVTGARPLETFSHIIEDPNKLMLWYLAIELMNKATPDLEPNEELFQLLYNLLQCLNAVKAINLLSIKIQFKSLLMSKIGASVALPDSINPNDKFVFNSSHGGFFLEANTPGESVPWSVVNDFKKISQSEFGQEVVMNQQDLEKLDTLLSNFIKHYLEREIHSENFLL